MEKKKALTFMFSVVAIILGVVLFKQIDFKSLKIEKPALALVYVIGFIISVTFLIRNRRTK